MWCSGAISGLMGKKCFKGKENTRRETWSFEEKKDQNFIFPSIIYSKDKVDNKNAYIKKKK